MSGTRAEPGRGDPPRPTPGATRQRTVGCVIALGLFALVVVKCAASHYAFTEPEIKSVYVENASGQALLFRELVNGVWYDFGTFEHQGTWSLIHTPELTSSLSLVAWDGCTIGDFVAYTVPGNLEVARHSPGLCVGDTWVIGPIEPSPS